MDSKNKTNPIKGTNIMASLMHPGTPPSQKCIDTSSSNCTVLDSSAPRTCFPSSPCFPHSLAFHLTAVWFMVDLFCCWFVVSVILWFLLCRDWDILRRIFYIYIFLSFFHLLYTLVCKYCIVHSQYRMSVCVQAMFIKFRRTVWHITEPLKPSIISAIRTEIVIAPC